jgi:hypothetical protein
MAADPLFDARIANRLLHGALYAFLMNMMTSRPPRV